MTGVIRAALVGHSDEVFDLLAMQLAYLGSKEEWSVDDNLDTTAKLVRLAEEIGLHPAGDRDTAAVEFSRAAAAYMVRSRTRSRAWNYADSVPIAWI